MDRSIRITILVTILVLASGAALVLMAIGWSRTVPWSWQRIPVDNQMHLMETDDDIWGLYDSSRGLSIVPKDCDPIELASLEQVCIKGNLVTGIVNRIDTGELIYVFVLDRTNLVEARFASASDLEKWLSDRNLTGHELAPVYEVAKSLLRR